MTDLVASKSELLINQLMSLHPSGYDFSLDRIERLLAKLGHPEDQMPPMIHVAGTNGKGSFTAFARALLEAEGHKVHVHTSPHLVRWHERFRIGAEGGADGGAKGGADGGAEDGGVLVSDDMLHDAISKVATTNDGDAITVFEMLTAAMFVLFSQQPADVAIIETGLGGRLDSTNVIKNPAVSVIMSISMDHMSFLGETPEKIALEKAGIMKRSCPVTISQQIYDGARDVLIERAKKLSCPHSVFGQDFAAFSEHGRLVYQDEDGLLDLPLPKLQGQHQFENAATAIRAVRDAGFRVSQSSAEKAMMSVEWPGRFQKLTAGRIDFQDLGFHKTPDIYLDGGHNKDSARVLVNLIKQNYARSEQPFYMIAGMLNTKDPKAYFEQFKGLPDKIIAVPLQSTQADIPSDELTNLLDSLGFVAEAASDLSSAFKQIAAHLSDTYPTQKAHILMCGSLYLVGDMLKLNGTLPE